MPFTMRKIVSGWTTPIQSGAKLIRQYALAIRRGDGPRSTLSVVAMIVFFAIAIVIGCWHSHPPNVKWKGQDSQFENEAVESAQPP